MSTIVCTFISRGAPGLSGSQGQDILLFTPVDLRQRPHGSDARDMTEVLLLRVGGPNSTPGAPSDPLLASQWSLLNQLFLDPKKDLKLVRRGKKIPWGNGCKVEAFLWRTVDSYERGYSEEYEIMEAYKEQRVPLPDPASDPATREADLEHFRTVESKLGPDTHIWESFAYFDDPKVMPEEVVSTAFFSVVLPPSLDATLTDLAEAPLSAEDVAVVALDELYAIISNHYPRHSFKFWPPGHPPAGPKTLKIPDNVLKWRVFSYLLDVVAHFLVNVKPAHATIISSVFLRILGPIQPSVTNTAVSIVAFEKEACHQIAREKARGKTALSLVAKAALATILERPAPSSRDEAALATWKKKRPLLHLVTLGFTPATSCVLGELILYLLTFSSHPYSSLVPGAITMSKQQEREFLNRPDHLKITIAESRPGCEGVDLARRAHEVAQEGSRKAKALRDLSRPYQHGSLRSPGDSGGAYGTLNELLARAEDDVASNGATKVSINVIPDGALPSTILAAGAEVIVLVGAERLLPNGADVVAKIGALSASWAANSIKARVLVLATSDSIESSGSKTPDMPTGGAKALVGAWKTASAANYAGLEDFVKQVLDKKDDSVGATYPESEIVPAKFISAWITEAGVLNAGGIGQLSKERSEAEASLFGAL
ncbi:hypothetical protein RQP46_008478 [Phenoliferia psychrophenolica]